MSSPVFDRIKSSGALPSPAGVAIELLHLARDPQARIEDIISLVERDPATAGRIMKFANSAFAGVRQQVADLRRAIVLLGMRSVVNISMGFSLISNHRRGSCETFDYDEFWSDCAVRAATARHLARDPLNGNEAYTCGLLSQIGRLALATVFPEAYNDILKFCKTDCMAKLVELERKMFEIDHNHVTAEMLADWQLPQDFCQAVTAQDAPHRSDLAAGSREAQLAQLLHLGGLMGRLFKREEVRREYIANLLGAVHRMDMPRDDFPSHFDIISSEWEQTSEIFPIRTRHIGTWEEVSSRCRRPVVAAPPSARLLGTAQQGD